MAKGGALPVRDIKNLLHKSYSKEKPSDYGEYKVDHSLSDHKAQVYHHPTTKHTIVVHRGTADTRDVLNDIAHVAGYKGDRFYHGRKIQNQAEKKYGAKNVTTLGHSLGSLVSSEVGKNSKEIINYNKPIDIRGRSNSNEYNIQTSRDPFSFIVPRKKTVTIKSKTLDPVHEHSIDRLNELPQEQMIGAARDRGLSMFTAKELKQRIKEHNRTAKPKDKIKGYGKMKKKELKEALHRIPGLMKGGGPTRRDSRFSSLEDMVDDILEEDDLSSTMPREWLEIKSQIAQAVNNKFPIIKHPKGELLPDYQKNEYLRKEALDHLKEFWEGRRKHRNFVLSGLDEGPLPKLTVNKSQLVQIVDEYFHLLDYYNEKLPAQIPSALIRSARQTLLNQGVKYDDTVEDSEWTMAMRYFVTYFKEKLNEKKKRKRV